MIKIQKFRKQTKKKVSEFRNFQKRKEQNELSEKEAGAQKFIQKCVNFHLGTVKDFHGNQKNLQVKNMRLQENLVVTHSELQRAGTESPQKSIYVSDIAYERLASHKKDRDEDAE